MRVARIVTLLFTTALLLTTGPSGFADDVGGAAGSPAGSACRAPGEPGCTTCCRALDDGTCSRLSWTGGPESTARPWYNATEGLARCPAGCRPCARCLSRDADDLAALKARRPADCDCASVEIGVDPCHAPMSCACFCARSTRLTAQCGG